MKRLGTYQTQRNLYKRVALNGRHLDDCKGKEENPKECDCYKRSNGGSGFTTAIIGKEDVTYEVLLDESKLKHMAVKAAASKSKRSVDGALSVRVTAQLPAD